MNNEKPTMNVHTKKRRFGFWKFLLLFSVLMLILIAVGTYFFWDYIEIYETSRHEHIINAMRENVDYAFWEASVREALRERLTVFERDAPDFLKPHLPKITDVTYTFRANSEESTDTSLVYTVRAGARDIGIVRLTTAGDAGYGFSNWEVESIELLDSFMDGYERSISITATQNAQVSINGIPLTEQYRVESEFAYAAIYYVEGIFGEVDVAVTEFDGNISTPDYADGEEFIFPIIMPFEREYRAFLPERYDVYLDGALVPDEFIAEKEVSPGIFDGLDGILDVLPKYNRYEIRLDWLYAEPDVYVLEGEREAHELVISTAEDGATIFEMPYSVGLEEQHKDRVESFIRAYVSFAVNIGADDAGNRARVLGFVHRRSPLYERMQISMTGSSQSTVTYNELDIGNFIDYGDEYFSCEVYYDITNRTFFEAREVIGHYELLFVNSGDRWLVMQMKVI